MSVLMLNKGTSGPSVKLLQRRLIANGFVTGAADAYFGPKTEEAVIQFQLSHGLVADGIVGDKTWDALLSSRGPSVPVIVLKDQREYLLKLASDEAQYMPASERDIVMKIIKAAVRDIGAVEVPDGSNGGKEIEHLVRGYGQYWWITKDGVDKNKVRSRRYALEDEVVSHLPWCGMAVSNWIREGFTDEYWIYGANIHIPHGLVYSLPISKHPFRTFLGSAGQFEEVAVSRGMKMFSGSDAMTNYNYAPMPGDVFTMGRGKSGSDPAQSIASGHVGIVVSRDPSNRDYVYTIEGNISNGVGYRRRSKGEIRWFIRWW